MDEYAEEIAILKDMMTVCLRKNGLGGEPTEAEVLKVLREVQRFECKAVHEGLE